jgi:hypothetical protein
MKSARTAYRFEHATRTARSRLACTGPSLGLSRLSLLQPDEFARLYCIPRNSSLERDLVVYELLSNACPPPST